MKNWRDFVTRLCSWVAAAFLAAMMALTILDVASRAVFNRPIRGTFELVELLLAYTFFLALPATFLRDDNIVVDVVDGIAPRRVPMLKRIAAALGVVLLAAMGWQSWIAASDAIGFGDVTADLSLPKILYWIPVLAGIIGAALTALAVALRRNGGS